MPTSAKAKSGGRGGCLQALGPRQSAVRALAMLNWLAVRLLFCFLLAVGAYADSKYQTFSDFTIPLPVRTGDTLVLGIVGGWERWDAPQRGVRRTALELRRLGLPGVWVETVENHRMELAQELIERAFDVDRSGKLDPAEIAAARIVIYGQSLGGRASLRLCRWLHDKGIRVLLVVLIDSYGRDSYTVPPNVMAAANLFQRDFGPVRGARAILAEDASKTRIYGNWVYRYRGREIPMPGEPWTRKWFLGGHLKMEYDPEPWARVCDLVVQTVQDWPGALKSNRRQTLVSPASRNVPSRSLAKTRQPGDRHSGLTHDHATAWRSTVLSEPIRMGTETD